MPKYKTARCIVQRDEQFLLAVHTRYFRQSPRRWGLLGGSIEWGEAPEAAVRRELSEEIDLELGHLHEVGAYEYKRAKHIVFAGHTDIAQFDYDEFELVDIGWFTLEEIEQLARRNRLHAGYELSAIRRATQIGAQHP